MAAITHSRHRSRTSSADAAEHEAVGVLRFRLLGGIALIARRALLYAALTGLVIAVYAATTAALSGVALGLETDQWGERPRGRSPRP